MTEALPPLFLAVRALDRFRSSPALDYDATRSALLAYARRARLAGPRHDYAQIIGLLLDARRFQQAREAALTRLMLRYKVSPDGTDTLTQWYAAMLGETEKPEAKTPIKTPSPVTAEQPKPTTPHQPTHLEATLLALTQSKAASEAKPKRPIGQTHAREIHAREIHALMTGKASRPEEKAARDHAERWYQAIRQWRVQVEPGDKLEKLTVSSGAGNMVAIAGNWASQPKYLDERRVMLPGGRLHSEANLAALCNHDPTLNAIREGRTLATLVDPRGGWHQNRQSAIQYAHVVLCLAFYLGDQHAQKHLRSLPLAQFPC